MQSNSEIPDMIRDFAPQCDDQPVIAFGASNHSVAEQKALLHPLGKATGGAGTGKKAKRK